MCFSDDDYTYKSRVEVRNGQRYHTEDYYPRFGMSRRRKYGLGGSYYPSRYYAGPPRGRYMSNAANYANRYSQSGGGYPRGVVFGGYSRGVVPDRYSQAMVPRGFVGGGYPGYSSGYAYGTGYHVGARNVMPVNSAMRTYYNTAPGYGYTAHVYPPGPTTTTTTYHVTNSQAQNYSTPVTQTVRETRPAYVHGHAQQGPTREDIQMENRRIATERGSYDPRKIRPADARDDDPFWCREVNGEWHLRSYYQIENECHPGRWMMDADVGFLVFHRT